MSANTSLLVGHLQSLPFSQEQAHFCTLTGAQDEAPLREPGVQTRALPAEYASLLRDSRIHVPSRALPVGYHESP